MNELRNLHPLEPKGIRANVPPPDGAMQSGHAVDFLSTTTHMHKAQAGITRSGAGEGGLAFERVTMEAMTRAVIAELVPFGKQEGVK